MENQEIMLKETNGEMVIDTRNIAEMMKSTHDQILRKLDGAKDRKGIIQILTDNQMVVSKYFIESTYVDDSGKENKCYLLTKKGCEILANKFTGEKGVLFTVAYVEAFNTMETTLKQVDNSPHSALTLLEDKQLIESIKTTLEEVKQATMMLTHKEKIDLTKNLIYPQLEMLGIESKFKKEVTKIIKESLITNGKWENIRIDDKFDKVQFKTEVRECAEIIKKNNPCYFKNTEFENISLFD